MSEGNPQDGTNIDPVATLLSEIKDESGRQKYNDVTTALNALKASQEYIPTLKTEIQALKERAELQTDVSKIADLLKTETKEETSEPGTPEAKEEPSGQTLQETLDAYMQNYKQEEFSQSNVNSVQSTLKDKFGDKHQEVYDNKAKELGLTTSDLDAMAKKSPKAVLAYFSKELTRSITPESSINSSGMKVPAKEVKNIMYGASSQDVRSAWEACRPEQ